MQIIKNFAKSLDEAGGRLKNSGDVRGLLEVIVREVALSLQADTCSLLLFDEISQVLTLAATYGLNVDMVGTVNIQSWEGLSGLTVTSKQPIAVPDVRKHKEFKHIPGLGEESFLSFLSIPLLYNDKIIGVLVIQNKLRTTFRKSYISTMTALGDISVQSIEKARLLDAMIGLEATPGAITLTFLKNHQIRGLPASPGIAFGRLRRIPSHSRPSLDQQVKESAEEEIQKFETALAAVKMDIAETRSKAEKRLGRDEAEIFEAYLLILESRALYDGVIKDIKAGKSAIDAVEAAMRRTIDKIYSSQDDYLKERAYDMQDIAQNLVDHIHTGDRKMRDWANISGPTIFVAETLSASDFMHLDRKYTKAVISAEGGASSHMAILANSMGLPAVLGLKDSLDPIRDGDVVLVDGFSGLVIINPHQETIDLYQHQIRKRGRIEKSYLKGARQKARLLAPASRNILVSANVEMAASIPQALKHGADDFGLFRTEFPFLVRNSLPTEEEQYQLYKSVVKAANGRSVTFRTLDLGADKYLSYLEMPYEQNPSLGWRSIRLALDRRDLFRVQLRALLRAASHGPVKLLFPMITTLDEVHAINSTLNVVRKELTEENRDFESHPPLGAMVEVPAAVEITDALCDHMDFLSIGTNDLVQYTLAVDRLNPKVAHLYDPFHPAVLKLIERTATTADKLHIPVSVCGDIAQNSLLVPILIGLGITGLSMNPQAIPRVKTLIREISGRDCAFIARKVLTCQTGRAVRHEVVSFFQSRNLVRFLED